MAKSGYPPPYKSWKDVPGGDRKLLEDLAHLFGYLIGFSILFKTKLLLAMANAKVLTQRDIGRFLTDNGKKYGVSLNSYPWAKYGMDKDEYASTASVFSMEYKKVTGSDLSAAGLQEAFRNPQAPGQGLLTGSQYQQQLMQDAAIQKAYGWVKYGLDYSQWQAQKLSMRTELGRDIKDSEAATLLQYNTQARGSNQAVVARVPQQQPTVGSIGVGQSATR